MKQAKELVIVAFTPAFAEREVLWFSENEQKIKTLALNNPFWTHNALVLEESQHLSMSETLRKLDDLNYQKVQTVASPGDFATRGGIIIVFPINTAHPFSIEFFGNTIEKIEELEHAEAEAERGKFLAKELSKRDISHLHNLKTGNFLVHQDHGIGIYKRMEERQSDGKTIRYFVVEYAGSKEGKDRDTLYVPEDKAKKLSLYIGLENPTIHRLSGVAWENTKRKVTEDAKKMAQELLALYAKRHEARRAPYPLHAHQREFDDAFEYIETDDQQRAIEDIYADMGKEEPMDRLICGDVGFGKTEVAMRAAFQAVAAGKQVAVLCPTTILADQHYETFTARFAKFPVNIAMLSRFETKQAQKETVKRLAEGKVDIVIGTHRILSSDVVFKDIGLLVIDEEQRFGVKQKEKFKQLRENLDILSLSATPIPRTLYLALSGFRSISIINTPPLGRVPIETFVLPHEPKTIRQAIREELHHHGQVYFLHNKIATIESVRAMLANMVPEAKFKTAHGRTGEQQLRAILRDFKDKKFDVLVATTIIENGLDIKNVNTLIVDDATRLGLAQAYQIRGRVGRSEKKSKAYFLYSSKLLSEDAQKRLDALQEATELGSGYLIAQRDLEIRGAGNVLGKKQSGAINQVGLNLYCQILNEAVENLNASYA